MRRKDPFPGVGKAALSARIDDARLDDTDEIIARLALLRQMDFVEIAAHAHCDRSTVSRRYKKIIEVI